MLEIEVPGGEGYDSNKREFVYWNAQKLVLEHSLLSISAWEAKYHKPFLSSEKTDLEVLDYIRCMTINKNVDPNVYMHLSKQNIDDITAYINDPMTATWFTEEPQKEGTVKKKEIYTSELIYYNMVAAQIPFDPCQKWHINRLLTLIRIYAEKNKEPTKMPKKDMLAQRRSLNAARRAKLHSKG